MYDVKDVYEPDTLKDALKILREDESSIVINGGSDILIKNREGKYTENSLVSINKLEELDKIYLDEDGNIMIGSTCSFHEVEEDLLINDKISILSLASSTVGGPQLRNIGTVGGNLCNGVPSADTATSILVLDGILHLQSIDSIREIKATKFFTGPGKTVRNRDEILTFIEIKKENYENYFGHYIKYSMRKAMDIATLGVAVLVKLSDDKKILEDVKIAYAVAAPTPIRSYKLEDTLRGKNISLELMNIVDENYTLDVKPRTSWRASKEFRLKLISELTKRGLDEAIVKGGGTHVYES